MSEMTPPIGRVVDTSLQPCGHSPDDTEDDTCRQKATWHIAWDAQMENGLACDEHMVTAQQWVYVDRHPVGPVCGMPGSTWDFDSKRCFVDGLNDETANALALHVTEESKEVTA
jgi:hypothetical protein